MFFRQVNLLIPGTVRRVQKNTQYQQATPFGLPHRFPVWQSAAACQGESLKPSENEKGESNNVEVYLWSISRWHYRSCVDVPVSDQQDSVDKKKGDTRCRLKYQ